MVLLIVAGVVTATLLGVAIILFYTDRNLAALNKAGRGPGPTLVDQARLSSLSTLVQHRLLAMGTTGTTIRADDGILQNVGKEGVLESDGALVPTRKPRVRKRVRAGAVPKGTDVAIIGAGIIGLSIAYELSKRRVECTLFERGQVASGATAVTGGIIAPLWYFVGADETQVQLPLASIAGFSEISEELSEVVDVGPWFQRTGVMRVAFSEPQVEKLCEDFNWLNEVEPSVRWLTRQEVLAREPDLNTEALAGVLLPNDGYAMGPAYARGLSEAATRQGARILTGVKVTGFETSGQRVTGVQTDHGKCEADVTVLAAGHWIGSEDWSIQGNFPVHPVKGQVIVVRKDGFQPNGPVYNCETGAFVVPQLDGNLLVAATVHEGQSDDVVTVDGIVDMIATAVSTFPGLRNAEFIGARAGVRPGTPDGLPLMGPMPNWDGLVVASGHGKIGIALSPATGKWIAEYIQSPAAELLEPFSLSRPSIAQ